MANQLTKEEAARGFAIRDLSTDAQPFTTYHDPTTGREVWLPADDYSRAHYLRRGLRFGPAPALLQVKPVAVAVHRQEGEQLSLF